MRRRLGILVALIVLVLLGAYAGVLEYSRPHVTGDVLSANQFFGMASSGRIKEARLLDVDSYVVGTYVRDDGTLAAYNTPYLKAAATREKLLDLLLQAQVPTVIDQQTDKSLVSLGSMLIPTLILILLFVYMAVSYRRGTGLFGIRSGARRVARETTRVTFADVAGQDAAVAELREVAQFLSEPEHFAALGARIPKGVLLYGPPGCGKTLMARALAGETGASFFTISGSDFVELYVGVGASRVRDLFREARAQAPAIIFIDELDSIGRARGMVGTVQSHGEQEQSLNQVLAEMDGFSPAEGIIVVAATNRPDILDQALLRPGRFDRTVALERPDEDGRLAVLAVHARDRRLDPRADLAAIARRAVGLTAADLAGVVNEAALLAARAHRSAVAQEDLDEALQRAVEAPERQRRLSMRERSIGKRFAARKRITFADLAGVDAAVTELAEVRDYLADPDRFESMGARMPGGILLVGPPGCGKTLLARAVAGEANAAFLSVAASEFVEVFVGEGPARVRELFAEARAIAPSIVFIDELDAMGARRGTGPADGHRELDQTLNQVLIELDGFEVRSGVVVMGATNRPDILDPALVRPGRFDRRVVVDLPDRGARRAILALHTAGRPLSPLVDLDAIAKITQGFSGAQLANVLNEACLLAARARVADVPMALVEDAVERAVLGVSARGRRLTPADLRVVAYHEAGHALVRHSLPGTATPHRITVIPRGPALGVTWAGDDDGSRVQTKSELLDRMAGMLGGRVAEELALGEPGTAASGDLAEAAALARYMVTELGMSDALGPLGYPSAVTGAPSEEVAALVDREVRRLAEEARDRALNVLRVSRIALDRVAAALMEREVLDAAEFQRIVAGAPITPAVVDAP